MSALHVHPVSSAPPAVSAPHQAAAIRPAGPKPTPPPAPSSHGPAVILGGALARLAEARPSPKPPEPKAPPPAAASGATGRHINHVI